jgi:CheY-like chemotaxis protein
MKILIIDDDAEIRRLAAAFLARGGGVTVIEAESGEAGLTAAERDQPDVILLDALMPGLDGPATLEQLRRRAPTASIPVIFMTATSKPEDRERLERMDVRGVLAKPFNPLALAGSIRELLAR